VWKRCLVCDFEDFDFFDLEMHRTGEKRLPVQSGVVGVTHTKDVSVTLGVCVALSEILNQPGKNGPILELQ
jgi:hypothetical protein